MYLLLSDLYIYSLYICKMYVNVYVFIVSLCYFDWVYWIVGWSSCNYDCWVGYWISWVSEERNRL